jgi:Uma2 family endonuclease
MTGPGPSGFTVDDLASLGGEGRCCELIGGAVVVTPASDALHALVVRRLQDLFAPACPHDHQVFAAGVELDLPGGHRVRPDVVVAPVECVQEGRLEGTPLLVVEVVAPGSKVNDAVTKRSVYAHAGIPAYWIVDPADGELVALRLGDDGSYEEYADTVEGVGFHWPIKVAFAVADLTRPAG